MQLKQTAYQNFTTMPRVDFARLGSINWTHSLRRSEIYREWVFNHKLGIRLTLSHADKLAR
jgi:hypothetical protein